MKPAPFEYARVASLQEALKLLDDDDDARLLAGGQSLLVLMNLRLARPSCLVDIGDLRELDRISEHQGSVVLGALVQHARLESEPILRQRVPLLCEAARHIGHLGIRNRGTLGGSLAHADPAAELPAVMVALDATFCLESQSGGRREVAARDFFISHYTSALRPGEMLTWVRVPSLGLGEGYGFFEVSRRVGDFAMAGASCVARITSSGALSVSAGVMAIGATPVLLSAELALDVRMPLGGAAPELVARLMDQVTVEGYVRRLTEVCLKRSLRSALSGGIAPNARGEDS